MKKVLIVDDEEGIRAALAVVLGEKGYQTLEADNGTAAFDLATSQNPDLIISDVMMDNGNGFMLRELLKDDERTALIPVILMTGAAQNAGAWKSDPGVRYLLKPFNANSLVEVINSVLKKG